MKKYKVIKNGIETNSWIESPEMGANYYEPSFGEVGSYQVIEEDYDPSALEVKANALSYLASTDWYVVRFIETNAAIPEEVLTNRAQARIAAN